MSDKIEELNQKALIYFDANEPIGTNLSLITLALFEPESKVESLDFEISNTSFVANWVGS